MTEVTNRHALILESAAELQFQKFCLRAPSWRRAWQPTPVFLPGEFPWMEESGRLQSMGLQRVGHNRSTKHSTGFLKSPVILTNHILGCPIFSGAWVSPLLNLFTWCFVESFRWLWRLGKLISHKSLSWKKLSWDHTKSEDVDLWKPGSEINYSAKSTQSRDPQVFTWSPSEHLRQLVSRLAPGSQEATPHPPPRPAQLRPLSFSWGIKTCPLKTDVTNWVFTDLLCRALSSPPLSVEQRPFDLFVLSS